MPLSAILALAASAVARATNSKFSGARALLSLKSSYTRGLQLNASLRIAKRQIPYKHCTGVAASKGLFLAHRRQKAAHELAVRARAGRWRGGGRVDHAKALDARRWTEVVQAVLKRQAGVPFAPKDLCSSFINCQRAGRGGWESNARRNARRRLIQLSGRRGHCRATSGGPRLEGSCGQNAGAPKGRRAEDGHMPAVAAQAHLCALRSACLDHAAPIRPSGNA